VRINAQLVDAVSDDHLWAERFDRSLEDIFAVQDEVTGKIVEPLLGRLRAPPPRNRPLDGMGALGANQLNLPVALLWNCAKL
jgi:hypothetical protein